jgi:hypothetical protein
MSSKGKGTESSGSSANKGKGQAGRMPKIQQPMKRKISLPMRRSHTPSNMAKAEGFSCAMDHVESKPNEGRTWGTREVAPEEVEGDDGWIPGPANRVATEEYCGRAFGIVDKELNHESAPLDFLMTQLTKENKEMIMKLTADKMVHDFAAKSAAGKKCGGVDRAIRPSDSPAVVLGTASALKSRVPIRARRTASRLGSSALWKQVRQTGSGVQCTLIVGTLVLHQHRPWPMHSAISTSTCRSTGRGFLALQWPV